MSEIVPIIEDDRFFIKSFIIDESLNLNYWATTDNAIDNYLTTFIGQPFVITPDFGHPDANSGDELLVNQEKYRVGNIIEVGRDASNGKAWAISEITSKEAQRQIQDGEVRFVSPSILFNADTDMISVGGSDIVTKFSAAHIAGVKEPAYGMQKAQIKGTCGGSLGTCIPQLQAVQASIEKSKCGKVITIKEGKTIRVVRNASECVERYLRHRAEQGEIIDDDAIARGYSECEFEKEEESGEEKIEININLKEGEQDPNISSCTKCETGKCQCSSNKAKTEDNIMTSEDTQKDEKKSNEELEDKRKEEAKKASEEQKDKEEAEEDKDAPLDAEEDKKEDEKKDARIRALEAELTAEKTSFVETILAAKKATGSILEAEESSTRKSLEAETLVALKQLAAAYADKAEATKGKQTPYSVLNYQQASTSNGDDFLKLIGAKSN